MANKKLSPQIISPGEAWNNYVNSKEGHNAAAVTPAYLDFSKQEKSVTNVYITSDKKPDLYYHAVKETHAQKDRLKEVEKGHGTTKENKEKER